jgi:hypothetical protein
MMHEISNSSWQNGFRTLDATRSAPPVHVYPSFWQLLTRSGGVTHGVNPRQVCSRTVAGFKHSVVDYWQVMGVRYHRVVLPLLGMIEYN